MKLKLSINTIYILVSLYPLLLVIPTFIGVNAFFLTAPYFLVVCAVLMLFIFIQNKIPLFKQLPLLILLIFVVVLNFSSVRYSLPIFVLFFMLYLFIFLKNCNLLHFNQQLSESVFYVYLILSIPFLFLNNGWEEETNRFIGFIGSPTVFAGFIATSYILAVTKLNFKSKKFIYLTVITIVLVYLSKTRLILIFTIIYPLLKYLRIKFKWLSLKKLFIIFFLTSISIYPMYDIAKKIIPSLVSLRYEEGGRDASFGLRYYLYSISLEDFKDSTFLDQILGHGNEYSRNKIAEMFKFDLMPHNDFVRILLDWGILGLALLIILLYRLSKKNEEACYLIIVYMLLFYSNMVFNIYLISLIIILYSKNEKYKKKSS